MNISLSSRFKPKKNDFKAPIERRIIRKMFTYLLDLYDSKSIIATIMCKKPSKIGIVYSIGNNI